MHPLQNRHQRIETDFDIFHLAQKLFEAGSTHSAVIICKKLLAEQPDCREALHLIGIIEHQAGRNEEARRLFVRLLEIDHDNHVAWSNLGVVYLALNDIEYARDCFEHALRITPHHADTWNNLGTLYDKEDLRKAEDCFRQALVLNPSFVHACNNLALNCKKRQQIQESIYWYRRSLDINDQQPEIFCRLAEVLEQTSDIKEVVNTYALSLALSPDDGIRLKQETVLPVILPSNSEIDSIRETLLDRLQLLDQQQLSIANPLERARILFYLAYHGRNDRKYHELMARIYRNSSPCLTWQAPHVDRKAPNGMRIRIGFISRFFYNHTIAKLNIGCIEQFDRNRFHVTVLLIASGNFDEMTQRYAAAADEFVVLAGNLDQMRGRIASQRLDIIMYTDIGMEPCSYFLAFSRLAKVQCVTWGHPATSGIDTVDYFISHEDCETEESRASYSEKLFCLSPAAACACYARPTLPHTGRSLEYYGIDSGQNIYYCPQPPFKMHPDFDVLMKGILERDPKALVVLLRGIVPETEACLRSRLSQVMPAYMDRIIFMDPLPFDDYITMLELADVILDTPHFSGGSSSVEAFAVGTPIVTLPSQYLKGRLTYAWYARLGILDCIASNAEKYITTAVRLGTDQQARNDLSHRIRAASHLLFDDSQVVRELEIFFERVCAN